MTDTISKIVENCVSPSEPAQTQAMDAPSFMGGGTAMSFNPGETMRLNKRVNDDDSAVTLRASDGKMGDNQPTVAIKSERENYDTNKNSKEILFRLWSKIGTQAFQEWAVRRLHCFFEAEVLQSKMYGERSFNEATQEKSKLDDGSLSREEVEAENALREMWFIKKHRHSSQRRELAEQFAEQLTMSMQKLPLERTQENVIRGMKYIVRRLTPTECCRLMGLRDGWTIPANLIVTDELVEEFMRIHDTFNRIMAEYEGAKPPKPKTAAQVRKWLEKITNPETCPDAPRYKACGNGWATNQPRWILTRLLAADGINPFTGEETQC